MPSPIGWKPCAAWDTKLKCKQFGTQASNQTNAFQYHIKTGNSAVVCVFTANIDQKH